MSGSGEGKWLAGELTNPVCLGIMGNRVVVRPGGTATKSECVVRWQLRGIERLPPKWEQERFPKAAYPVHTSE